MERILSDKQIEQAKQMRLARQTKRQIAEYFGVSATTIWHYVFSGEPRNVKKKLTKHKCSTCEIITTKEINIKRRFIPMNYELRGKCLDCYLKERGVLYRDVMVILDYYVN